MKARFILFVLTIIASVTTAQNRNNIWCFGDSAGIDFTNINNPIPISSGMRGRGSCVSISDTSGNLLLYSFTVESTGAWSTHIFNNTHASILGADSITGEAWYNELALFPKPSSDSLYYLFSVGLEPNINQGLFLTTIDMSQNGGLGAVVQQNIQIDTNVLGDCIAAVKHGNGRDWWVVTKFHSFPFTFYNRFYVYYISPNSISLMHTIDFNDASDVAFQKIVWHPLLNKFMLINVRGYMAEFNFDRCNGMISLDRAIFPELNNLSRAFWGGAYSPNGNIFYTSRTSYGGNAGNYNFLLQYDLTAVNIPASCDTLDSTMYPIADCGDLRLAHDNKIYYSQAYPWGFPYQDTMRNTINENLGVVNNPDMVGTGCNFVPFSFYLGGKRTYYGLPNNPNYSLGADSGSVCDTLTSTYSHLPNLEVGLQISPNPASEIIYVNAQNLKGINASVKIIDMLGNELMQKEVRIFGGGYLTSPFKIAALDKGVYFVIIENKQDKLVQKFIKE